MGAESSRGEGDEHTTHQAIELHPDVHEEAKRISASISEQLGEGKRICILGDELAYTSAEAAELVRMLARDLPPVVGQRGVFLVDGEPGVQQLFAQNCAAGSTLWNLVPEGSEMAESSSSTRSVHAGKSLEENKAALVCLGDLFITVGGGLAVAKQAHHAHEKGAALLPIRSTGGASSGKHGFPEVALQKPPWVNEEIWRLLDNEEAELAETASAVVSAVRSWFSPEDCDSDLKASSSHCWIQKPSVGTWCIPLPISKIPSKKAINTSSEVEADEVDVKTMEPALPTEKNEPEEQTQVPIAPFVAPFEWRPEFEDVVIVPKEELEKELKEEPKETISSPTRLPVNSVPSVESASCSTSAFKLAPPPPPSSSVGSPLAKKEVAAFQVQELVDVVAPPPVTAVASPKVTSIEANLGAVAAALNVGPPPSLSGLEVKVKAFDKRENSVGADQDNSDEDTNNIAIAAAIDADVDDEACETLLGGEQTLAYSGATDTSRRLPLGRMALGDGIDGSSDEEEVKDKHTGATTAVRPPKRPEPFTSPGEEPPPTPPKGPPRAKSASSPASPPAAIVQPTIHGRDMADIDAQLTRTLDRFFENDKMWQQVASEISQCTKLRASMEWLQAIVPSLRTQFRVQVPEPYPGIQYRKSKTMTDRYPRYAKHGSIVSGNIEDDGEWLKITENVYLPMKVGAVEILKIVHAQELGREPAPALGVQRKSDDLAAKGVQAINSIGMSQLDEASRLLSGSETINPFTDTPRNGSPTSSPLRPHSDSTLQRAINPFSDTPPASPRATPMRTRPASVMS